MPIWRKRLSVMPPQIHRLNRCLPRWGLWQISGNQEWGAKVALGRETTCIVASLGSGPVFLDTNILAYRFDGSEPTKQACAAAALAQQRDFVISTQVMLELHSVLTRKLRPRWSAQDARTVVDELSVLQVVIADARLVCRAAATTEKYGFSIWDAMIIEAAVESGCSELWSEDLAAESTIKGVRVVNPFG